MASLEEDGMEQQPLLRNDTGERHVTFEEKHNQPWLLRYRCSKYFITATVTVAIFTDTFFFAVIIPALPFMLRERCNIPEADVQFWTSLLLALFGGAIIIGSPIGGYLADNLSSRRVPFYLGLGALAASTILFGITTGVWVLIVSRIFFGISSAIVYTIGLAIIIDSVDSEQVGEWVGIALSGATVGITISPLLGGFVYAKAKLNGILVMMITLVVIDVILRFLMIERKEAARWLGPGILPHKTKRVPRSDHTNATNADEQVQQDVTSDEQQAPAAAKPKKKAPLLRLLSSARVWADLYGVFMNFGILNSFDAVLPLFVKQKFHWSSTEAGLIFLNIAAPNILAPLAGKLASKFGTRRVAILGSILACPALICLRFVSKDTPQHVALLCVLLILSGLFLTLVMTPIAADLSAAVDAIEANQPDAFGPLGAYAQVYALFNCSMAGACIAGPEIAGTLRAHFGWGVMSLVLGIWCISAAVPIFFFVDDNPIAPTEEANSQTLADNDA